MYLGVVEMQALEPIEVEWSRMSYSGSSDFSSVWALTLDGRLVTLQGKALISYEEPRDRIPIFHESVDKIDGPTHDKIQSDAKVVVHGSHQLDSKAIVCYTDGACEGNPGPCGAAAVLCMARDGMGLGDVFKNPKLWREKSAHLGQGTNNVGELTAIEFALDLVAEEPVDRVKDRPLCIFTDSTYAQGMLAHNWKAKKNQQLIERIKAKLNDRRKTNRVAIHWVKGHGGVAGNERADELANRAAKGTVAKKSEIVTKSADAKGPKPDDKAKGSKRKSDDDYDRALKRRNVEES